MVFSAPRRPALIHGGDPRCCCRRARWALRSRRSSSLPFLDYLPWSPRALREARARVVNTRRAGRCPPRRSSTRCGRRSRNARRLLGPDNFKLHSEYSGAAVVLLALLSFRMPATAHGVFFVFLPCTGRSSRSATPPFYPDPVQILPMIKSTRAAGMIFTLTSFSIAVPRRWERSGSVHAPPSWSRQRQSSASRCRSEPSRLPRPLAYGVGHRNLCADGGGWRMASPWRTCGRAAHRTLRMRPQPDLCVGSGYTAFIADAFRALVFGLAVGALALPTVRRRECGCLGAGARRGRPARPVFCGASLPECGVQRSRRRDARARRSRASDQGRHERPPVFVLPRATCKLSLVHGIRSTLGYNAASIHRYDERWVKESWPTR